MRRNIWLLAAFVLIFVFGICVGYFLHHKNHINFLIRANGDVNVAPELGDDIVWVMESADENGTISTPGAYVKFGNYGDNVPCKDLRANQNVHSCEITSIASSYLYSCKTSGGLDCADPHVGPGTRTGYDQGNPNGNPQGIVVANNGNPEPQISCLSKADGYVASVDSIENASPNDVIQWTQNPGGAVGYSFTLADSAGQPICNQGLTDFSSRKPLQLCTPGETSAGTTYPYTVKFTSGQCSGKTYQATLKMK
jgi:hypothetical protein